VSEYDVVAFAALGWEARAVLAGLQDVRPADGPRRWCGRLADGGTCLVVQTGMGSARAEAAARAVPSADAVLSLGCGGGLVPWLRTGDVVVATEVVQLDGSCRPGARAAAVVPRVDLGAHEGAVASSPGVLLSIAEKTAAAGCGALLVDMESWTFADEAERRGVPFAAVRVVLDGVTDELPALSDAIDAGTGDIDLWRVARALVPKPWIWPAVLRIARQQWEAERRLAEAVALLLRCHPSTWTREDTRDGRRPAVRDRPVDERQRLPDLADSGRRCGGPGGRARHRG
jgi:nucleoside phosphorylase